MKINHIAIWVTDLEAMKSFYTNLFSLASGVLYHNPIKGFSSYFLNFPDGDMRLELMHHPDVKIQPHEAFTNDLQDQYLGLSHLAISLGSKQQVDNLTKQCKDTGIRVVGQPRLTGDGYYESVILDPEGNIIELTI